MFSGWATRPIWQRSVHSAGAAHDAHARARAQEQITPRDDEAGAAVGRRRQPLPVGRADDEPLICERGLSSDTRSCSAVRWFCAVALRRRASDRIGTATRNSVQPDGYAQQRATRRLRQPDGYAQHGAVALLRR